MKLRFAALIAIVAVAAYAQTDRGSVTGLIIDPGGSPVPGATATTNRAGQASVTATANTIAGSFTVTASITGSSTPATFTLANNPGTANKLAFSTQPGNALAGASPGNIAVSVEDRYGNVAATSTAAVIVAIETNPGSGKLSGTLTVNATLGVATFSDLSINKMGTGYTVRAHSAGLVDVISSAFNIFPAAHFQLVFTTEPVTPVTAGAASIGATVTEEDQFGNVETGDNSTSMTLAIANGTGASGAMLNGAASQTVSAGVATFSGLTIYAAATGYKLTATVGAVSKI